MDTPRLPQFEERIISYLEYEQVQQIIQEMGSCDFLLIEHKSRTKQLFFKKIPYEPETLIIGEQ
ncbi:MAG: hypothetical protein WC746_01780 [archaeon]|jgi:hypothetical protein